MQCEKKQLKKKEAEAILKHKQKAPHHRKKEVRYYHCPICNWWHLTSKETTGGVHELDVKEVDRWKELLTIKQE
jgi:hypothetical protein